MLDEAEQLGLDRQLIALHLERVTTGQPPRLPIVECCRLDNGGILPLLDNFNDDVSQQYVSFVPAAGAATRFTKVFAEVIELLTEGNYQAVITCLAGFKKQGLLKCPLTNKFRQLIAKSHNLSEQELAEQKIDELFPSPKALYPCVVDGASFLDLKIIEHRAIGNARQVFVIPTGCQEKFIAATKNYDCQLSFLEQGLSLSTLRFSHGKRLVVRQDNKLSPVPAGHGVLTALFSKMKDFAPSAFIRNIDNVMGLNPQAIDVCKRFLAQHYFLLTSVQKIRHALQQRQLEQANSIAQRLHKRLLNSSPRQLTIANADLWLTLHELFHAPLPTAEQADSLEQLLKLYSRPVNSLGQVPNSGNDMGGIPVFVDFHGKRIKICLEIPHMIEADRHGLAKEASHFNPVFVACELDADYPQTQNPFWLLAEKNYRGQQVCYHETLLYETLGNSLHCNAVFVDVPRSIFNPHKTLNDATGKHLSDWWVV